MEVTEIIRNDSKGDYEADHEEDKDRCPFREDGEATMELFSETFGKAVHFLIEPPGKLPDLKGSINGFREGVGPHDGSAQSISALDGKNGFLCAALEKGASTRGSRSIECRKDTAARLDEDGHEHAEPGSDEGDACAADTGDGLEHLVGGGICLRGAYGGAEGEPDERSHNIETAEKTGDLDEECRETRRDESRYGKHQRAEME